MKIQRQSSNRYNSKSIPRDSTAFLSVSSIVTPLSIMASISAWKATLPSNRELKYTFNACATVFGPRRLRLFQMQMSHRAEDPLDSRRRRAQREDSLRDLLQIF